MPKFYKTKGTYFLSVFIFSSCLTVNLLGQVEKSVGIDFDCSETFEIHPKNADFGTGPNSKPGRILISALHDDQYYPTEKTAIDNMPAQIEDGKVRITVHIVPALTPTGEPINRMIYFKLFDPDDASPYEGSNEADDLGDDNLGNPAVLKSIEGTAVPQEGVEISAITQTVTINGVEVAAAEVILDFSEMPASGDNYIVKAGIDPEYEIFIDETDILVLWKRIYFERDEMYREGATLILPVVADADNFPDVIKIDNSADFSVDDKVILFDKSHTSETLTVIGVISTSSFQGLRFADFNDDFSFDRWGGVRKVTTAGVPLSNAVFEIDNATSLIKNGYGGDTYGTDGGVFVEFSLIDLFGSDIMPKYSVINEDEVIESHFNYWFFNESNSSNVFHLVGSNKYTSDEDIAAGTESKIIGVTGSSINMSSIGVGAIEDKFSAADYLNVVNSNMIHELGHQFNLDNNNHVDMENAFIPAHTGVPPSSPGPGDWCIMSYDDDLKNNIMEFDYHIIDGGIDNTCIGDIRKLSDPQ